jgi:hypothetical protein
VTQGTEGSGHFAVDGFALDMIQALAAAYDVAVQ